MIHFKASLSHVHCRSLLASKEKKSILAASLRRQERENNSVLVASLRRQERIHCSPWDRELNLPAQSCVPAPRYATSHPRLWRPVQGITGDSEGAISSEDMILDEQTLMMDLQKAIKDENYAWAAKIRDDLRLLQEDNKASVLAANARFYKAFTHGDVMGMRGIWSKGEHVCCVHPGAGQISGYDLVMESWELVFGPNFEFPLEFDLKNVEVHVRGDVGYVTCKEVVKTKGNNWGEQVATNVFEKVDGEWFICIHHASHVGL